MLGQLDFYVKKKEKLDVSLYITLKNNNSNGKKKTKHLSKELKCQNSQLEINVTQKSNVTKQKYKQDFIKIINIMHQKTP